MFKCEFELCYKKTFPNSKPYSEPNCPPKLLVSEPCEGDSCGEEPVETVIAVNEILPIGHPTSSICDPTDCNSGCYNGCMCKCKKTPTTAP